MMGTVWATAWLIGSTTPEPIESNNVPSWWQVVVAIGVVVGLVAGVQQIFAAVRRRRLGAAEERLLEIVATQLDADTAKQDAATYAEIRSSLRAQIEVELPAEARRLFLADRLKETARQIAREFEEYEAMEAEMGRLAPQTELDDRIRNVIETQILPPYKRQQWRERAVLVALLGLLILSISPLSAAQFTRSYFDVIRSSTDYTRASVVATVFGASLVVAVCIAIGAVWTTHRRGLTSRRTSILRLGVALVVLAGLLIAGALATRSASISRYNRDYVDPRQWDADRAAFRLYSEWAAGLFHATTLSLGIGIGLVVWGSRLQRHSSSQPSV
jgi:hypothetical protein